ncbi:hypothetical protein ASPZODRAFT_57629 [Penicilliopsis zonata CBS 506.65]|uniref:Phospholipase/carboxylesterase/thioesterase domain-containing protein n=1 Tax=Penicilliopsis zonata CBS 506.65 TaxID=1073090 RepID=A0A1L9SSF2_9EURO|nr:hypothetical protein ASPZODRAFT_57629 [Penicilliopsis zonata CBS 506.65]OJJ50036.1 hypothetical protein ASPZODRAFT_57629 [Penicilliopsis zonata CBS 506.65]
MVYLFPPRYVYFPSRPTHTSTVILLHGRGSNGPELASELVSSVTSSGKTIFEHFPSCRWVFPSARPRWSKRFQETLTEWFDSDTLEDYNQESNSNNNSSIGGNEHTLAAMTELAQTVEYILRILNEEVVRLGGNPERVILGGLSQGMAVAVIALICARQSIGGFMGVMGWLPLSTRVEAVLNQLQSQEMATDDPQSIQQQEYTPPKPISHTPIFLSHGEDDQWVDVSLGEKASELLVRLGFDNLIWRTYSGAEVEGHWIKEPEQFDAMVEFLQTVLGSESEDEQS